MAIESGLLYVSIVVTYNFLRKLKNFRIISKVQVNITSALLPSPSGKGLGEGNLDLEVVFDTYLKVMLWPRC